MSFQKFSECDTPGPSQREGAFEVKKSDTISYHTNLSDATELEMISSSR